MLLLQGRLTKTGACSVPGAGRSTGNRWWSAADRPPGSFQSTDALRCSRVSADAGEQWTAEAGGEMGKAGCCKRPARPTYQTRNDGASMNGSASNVPPSCCSPAVRCSVMASAEPPASYRPLARLAVRPHTVSCAIRDGGTREGAMKISSRQHTRHTSTQAAAAGQARAAAAAAAAAGQRPALELASMRSVMSVTSGSCVAPRVSAKSATLAATGPRHM